MMVILCMVASHLSMMVVPCMLNGVLQAEVIRIKPYFSYSVVKDILII